MAKPWTDRRIENYISRRLKELDIEYGDFIAGRVHMEQILTIGDFNQFRPYDNFEIPLKDLFRYWWNNFADQGAVIDDVLDCICTEFKDRAAPPSIPIPEPDYSDAIEGFTDIQQAAESSDSYSSS